MPFNKSNVRVKVPRRSGFDKSHRNSGTGKCGQLLPLLCDEVIPNTRISLKIPFTTQLPPLVSDTYMNVKHKIEAFFVPGRLLCKSYEGWFCDRSDRVFYTSSASASQASNNFYSTRPAIPCVTFQTGASAPQYVEVGSGSLLDYLGYGRSALMGDTINLLPLIAYHLVYQEYYRNATIQNPVFTPSLAVSDNATSVSTPRIANITDTYFFYSGGTLGSTNNYNYILSNSNEASFTCADGVSLFAIRQRNFGLDLFTGARASAQQGTASSVSLAIPAGTDAAGGSTSFSIAQLRAANSLQMFRERNNLPGQRLVEQVKARYGANLSDGVAQRPICLGSASYDYGSRGISQTAITGTTTGNLFNDIGAEYGRAYVSGSDYIIEDFVANEPGYILVLHSQVPEVTYTYGVDPMFTRYVGAGSIVDMANPLLQNVGDQPITADLVTGNQTPGAIFGYNDRYFDFMFKKNMVHGKLRQGENLSSYVLQRALLGANTINSSFLQIPVSYLDDIMNSSVSTTGLTYWYDAMLEYKVSMPLAEFSIPSLQDPAYEHGQSVNLRRNGQIF